MTVFELLILSHLVGDFLVQTEFEALNKALGKFFNRALLVHCLKYTLCFAPFFWNIGSGYFWLLLIFSSHMVLDRRWLIIWWRHYVNRNSPKSIENTFWLTVVVDQIFHILVLALISLML